jgi:hypothetical protein
MTSDFGQIEAAQHRLNLRVSRSDLTEYESCGILIARPAEKGLGLKRIFCDHL